MLLETSDFQTITENALRHFEERVASEKQSLHLEVTRLEAQLVQLYGIAALLAKREPDVDAVAAIWQAMITACDAVSERIQALSAHRPLSSPSFDKILEIRRKAARLRDLHA